MTQRKDLPHLELLPQKALCGSSVVPFMEEMAQGRIILLRRVLSGECWSLGS